MMQIKCTSQYSRFSINMVLFYNISAILQRKSLSRNNAWRKSASVVRRTARMASHEAVRVRQPLLSASRIHHTDLLQKPRRYCRFCEVKSGTFRRIIFIRRLACCEKNAPSRALTTASATHHSYTDWVSHYNEKRASGAEFGAKTLCLLPSRKRRVL